MYGLYTIMVVPVKRTDGFITKFNRIIERRLLNYFKIKAISHGRKIDWMTH